MEIDLSADRCHEGESAEVDVGEVQLGLRGGCVVQADAFAAEGFADMVVATFM